MTGGAPHRKGWCPGALRPMSAKDGLLVRLRVTAGRLSASTLRVLAEAGRDHGNGLFDLTSRGNLQMRGISPKQLPRLFEILQELGLLDETISGEAVRNVLISPLAGLESRDIGRVAAALEGALVEDEGLHALPGKFGFLIDDGGTLPLAGIPADIRFTRTEPSEAATFAIGLGGDESAAAIVGSCLQHEIVPTAVRLARTFLRFSLRSPGHVFRMRDLLHFVTAETIAAVADLPPACPGKLSPVAPPVEPCPIGPLRLGNGASCFGAGATFGRLDASMLDKAADAAESFGCGEIRLTPFRALLFPGIEPSETTALRAFLSERSFITDPEDARLAVAACGGFSACASATTDTRADALSLASTARRLAPTGVALHVSGCEKGCARPAATRSVLVAREGGYDLVLEGTADGAPLARSLTLPMASTMLEDILRERRVSH